MKTKNLLFMFSKKYILQLILTIFAMMVLVGAQLFIPMLIRSLIDSLTTETLSGETLYALAIVDATGIDRDWQEVFFDGGNITSHSFAARGGNENTKFSASLRYLGDEGVIITDDYKLYTANVKMDSNLGNSHKLQDTVL